MVMLTDLLRFRVEDLKQRGAALSDLAVNLFDEDCPFVTHLFICGEANEISRFDWAAVKKLDFKHRKIVVSDLDSGSDSSEISGTVLLRHDVLDALIIDLLNRRTTRANDLQLVYEEPDRLRLRAIDASFGALLRRISRGLYSHVSKDSLFEWKYVEFLRGDPQAVDNGAGYRLRIARLPAGEIAQLTDYLPYLHAAELLTLLPDPKAADVLELMPPARQLQVFEEYDEAGAVELLALMSPDLAADLVARLHTSTMTRYLKLLPRRCADRIIELLRYPEESVGGVMINDFIFIRASATVAEARRELRERLREPDFVSLIFLVDDEENRCLRGVLSLRRLLTEDDGAALEELMDPFVETLGPLDSAIEAAHRIVAGQFPAMPVVADERRLIGVMTIDAAFAQLAPAVGGNGSVRIFS